MYHISTPFKNKQRFVMLSNRSLLNIAGVSIIRRLSNRGKTLDLNYTCYENKTEDTDSPVVVVLHGLLASRTSWVRMSEAIHQATGRKIVNVDARNHGTSPHSHLNTYLDMADDTVQLINKLALRKVTLLGHSMGGRTAMTISLLYPELVSSMIIVDISPVYMPVKVLHNFPRIMDFINALSFQGADTVDEAISNVKDQMQASGITQKDVVYFILENIGVKPDETIGWSANMNALKEYILEILSFPHFPSKMFAGPTLFIKAGQTDFLRKEDLPDIRAYYPQAEMKCIPGVGHNIHLEDHNTLLKFIIEFLK